MYRCRRAGPCCSRRSWRLRCSLCNKYTRRWPKIGPLGDQLETTVRRGRLFVAPHHVRPTDWPRQETPRSLQPVLLSTVIHPSPNRVGCGGGWRGCVCADRKRSFGGVPLGGDNCLSVGAPGCIRHGVICFVGQLPPQASSHVHHPHVFSTRSLVKLNHDPSGENRG